MTLVRWQPINTNNPFTGFPTLQRRMNRLFDEFVEGNSPATASNWSPRVDLIELDDHFEVTAELPGMPREAVKVELRENVLAISGEKVNGSERNDHNQYICERSFGQFVRRFQFPTQIDASKINATFKDGILTITLPKAEEAKPKQIEVKIH